MATGYSSTADSFVTRILALIPEHPYILEMDSPWALFKVPGFDCADLQPTMYQAEWALAKAQQLWRERQHHDPM